MRLFLTVLLTSLTALAGDARHEVHRACFDCRTECRRSRDRGSCDRACLVMKAAECRRRGMGPGPRTTCDCT